MSTICSSLSGNPSHTHTSAIAVATRHLSVPRWRAWSVAVVALVLVALFGVFAAQASAVTPASLYWVGDSSVGTVQINDATGVLADGTRNNSVSTGCTGYYDWTANSVAVYGTNGRYVCRGSLDGVSPAANSSWITTSCGDSPGVGAVYATDDYVYYMCTLGGVLGRVDVDGTNNIQNFGNSGGASMDYAYRLAVDANWIYVTGSQQIRRYPIDGGSMDPSWAITGLGDLRGLAVDSQYLYWSTYPSRYIGRANLDGTGKNSQWIAARASSGEGVWGITVTGSSIYWMTRTAGSVGRANLDGTGVVWPLLDNITANGQNHKVVVLGGTAKTPLGAALTNTVAPVVSGTVEIGQTLTADTGTWSATPAAVYYQWQVSADSGTTWTEAPGAGAKTASYTIAVADMTKLVRVRVRAGAAGGLLTYASSDPTIAVPPPPPPINTTAPALTARGIVVSVTRGSWTNPIAGVPTYAYQWQTSPTGVDGSWVSATGGGNATAVYVALAADAGGYLRACVTASNGSDATACTEGTAAPVPTAPLSRFFQKTKSVLGDGSAPVTYANQSGVWGFSSNGTRTVYAGWTNLYSAPAGGGSAPSLATYSNGSQSGVLIDSQYVYFPLGGAIQRIDIDGSNRITSFIPGVNRTYILARDRNYLYFTQDGDIARAPIGGGAASTLVSGADARGVAVSGDYIYWTRSSGGTIGRADIGGTGANNAWATTSFSDMWGIGVDRNGVYVEARGGCGGPAIITLDGQASACVATINDDSYAISLVPDPTDAGALPVNAGGADAPTISGTSRTGNTLTVSAGSWTNTPASYTYRWLVSNDGSTGWSVASGVTGTTDAYLVPGVYAGKYLKARVIAHNGSTWSDAAYTDSVWVPAPPANTVVPAVTGTVRVGVSLSADSGTWTFPPADASGYAYEWQVSDTGTSGWSTAAGAGSATASYAPDASKYGKYLRVKVTATNTGGSTDAYSVASVVLPIAPVNSGVPVVTGTVQIGRTLSVDTGSWTSQQAPTGYVYEWQVSDTGTSGWSTAAGAGRATASYAPDASEYGKFLRVKVTATNTGGSTDAYSEATGVVLPVAPVSSVVPVVTGTVQVGETLSVDTGSWTSQQAPTGYVYEWQVSANGTDWAAALGDGGDSSEYDVDLTDDNQYLRVQVTATNDGGSTIAYSAATSLVDILAPTSSTEPEVTGTIEIGRTLTASSGTWDYATDYAYAWQSSADGSTWEPAPGEGAASSSYTVAAADAGRYLRVRVTGSNRNGSLLASSASSARVPSPVSPVVDTPPAVVPVVFSPAPGITVGETRGETVLAAAVPAAGADLLRGAKIWVRPSSKVEYLTDALPAGLKLVDGKLVATKPGTYRVQVKVKRANGTTVTRTIKIKVG